MKNRLYNLQLQTPQGECKAAADTMPGLVEITPRGLFGDLLERPEKKPEDRLDMVARELWAAVGRYWSVLSKIGLDFKARL